MARAQRFADRFANLNWPVILNKYAKRVNPQLQDILHGCQYYWVSAQSEYSTDILFKTRQDLCELYPQLLSRSTLCFGAKEVMNFLGRKLHGKFEGEIISDLSSLVCRRTGASPLYAIDLAKRTPLPVRDPYGLPTGFFDPTPRAHPQLKLTIPREQRSGGPWGA